MGSVIALQVGSAFGGAGIDLNFPGARKWTLGLPVPAGLAKSADRCTVYDLCVSRSEM
jgi:hypothetical protein